MDFNSGKALLELCEQENLPISSVMRKREEFLVNMTAEECDQKMHKALDIMKNSVHEALGASGKVCGRIDRRRGGKDPPTSKSRQINLWRSALPGDRSCDGGTGIKRIHGAYCGGSHSGVFRRSSGTFAGAFRKCMILPMSRS